MSDNPKTFEDVISPSHINIYLAGPLSDYEHHEQLHEDIIKRCDIDLVNFVDPLIIEPSFASGWEMMRRDLGAVEMCDAVLAYRVGVETWGTKAEIFHALRVGTPVVIYDVTDSDDTHNHWMTGPFTVLDNYETVMEACVALARLYRT